VISCQIPRPASDRDPQGGKKENSPVQTTAFTRRQTHTMTANRCFREKRKPVRLYRTIADLADTVKSESKSFERVLYLAQLLEKSLGNRVVSTPQFQRIGLFNEIRRMKVIANHPPDPIVQIPDLRNQSLPFVFEHTSDVLHFPHPLQVNVLLPHVEEQGKQPIITLYHKSSFSSSLL